ncbi:MIP aquaporin family, partial [Rhizoctonia solani]
MAHYEEPRAFHTRPHRQQGELEIGVTQAVGHIQQKESLHVVDIAPVPNFMKTWERKRPTWLMEMIAECWGVFCYTYAGVGATAALVITTSAQEENLGGLLNVAVAYGFGIAFAIITAASTSGGHFNPCVTIAFCLFRGFPLRKVPRYIFAQCLGAFIAGICVWGQYHRELGLITNALKAAGKEAQIFSSSGPAGVVAIFPAAGASMGRVFLNEFIVDFFVSTNIIWPDDFAELPRQLGWACLDPANPFVSASSVPFAIGMAYTAMIIGFVPGTIATNAARDFGARCAAAAIWGRDAFPSPYSAISALTNIPAMLCSVMFYEFFLSDSSRVVVSHAETLHQNAQAHAHHRRLTNEMIGESPMAIKRELGRAMTGHQMADSSSGGSKVEVDHREKV